MAGVQPEVKTPERKDPPAPPTVIRTNNRNPLNSYRSYTYNFTLASLKAQALVNPETYRQNQDYWVIAKSGGKGTTGLQNPTFAEKKNSGSTRGGGVRDRALTGLLNQFNSQSPGRFDFYIDNVEIETIPSGGELSGMSTATKIEFDVIEPYSMSGFIEALQVSAQAAGHKTYIQCPYLLKMEFKGYSDTDDSNSSTVPKSTRYFVFQFTGIDIGVTESGARYRCKAVPYNELGFGNASRLKVDIQIKGTTVETICKSLFDGVNQSIQQSAVSEFGEENKNAYDVYEIIFPTRTDTGIDDTKKNDIAAAKVTEVLKGNSVYGFSQPGDEKRSTINLSETQANFVKDSALNDCIASLIRDSSYTKDILSNFQSRIDERGMITYFMIHLEVEKRGIYNTKSQSDTFKYRYIVIPYKIHWTRVSPRPDITVDTSKLKQTVHREYNYLYTGQNVDILQFDLKFNTLFFQAIPKDMGNKSTPVSSVEPAGTPRAQLGSQTDPGKSPISGAPIKTTPASSSNNLGAPDAIPTQQDPYSSLARNMHKAILENVDQCTADIRIIGDPYYLVTGGMGNQRLALNADGTAGEGEAPIYVGDVYVLITFRNPVDIDTDTGLAYFDNRAALYSGVFQIINVKSYFTDGKFEQHLDLIRLPGQVEDTNLQPTTVRSNVDSIPNPERDPIPVPPLPPTAVRATEGNLISDIVADLPVAGLPGDLSNLIPGNLGGLAGAYPGRSNIGSLINDIIKATSGVVGAAGELINQFSNSPTDALSNVGTALRLAESGLSAASTNVNEAAATVQSVANTAQSLGSTNATPSNVANTLINSGAASASELGANIVSEVSNLGNQSAGLINSVSSNVDKIKGTELALAAQLGITPSALSGLSKELQSSITSRLSKAAKAIPSNVDITSAISQGLIFNNIPVNALKNIPATQPISVAPPPPLNLSDVKAILERGGSLANLPGADQLPGALDLAKSIKDLKNSAIESAASFNAAGTADKVNSIQDSVNAVTGNQTSVENALNNVAAIVPGGMPNTEDVASSVVSQFGSLNPNINPLAAIIRGR